MTLVGPQRQRQDDPAADALGRARPRRGHALDSARAFAWRSTTSALRAADVDPARVRHRRPRLDRRDRGRSSAGSSSGWRIARDEATLSAYADAQGRLEHAGGYRWRDGIEVALPRSRLQGRGARPPARELLRRRADPRLARPGAGGSKPDLLLLDEPTNHLDIDSLEWLESYLTGVDAAVILVAHDRWFLESVGTSVLELEAGRARCFKGPWHAWRAEQAARELAAGRDVARREAEIARMERFVERFRYKATKARQAQSKLKAIERVQKGMIEAGPSDGRALAFSFGDAERSGRVVLELEGARVDRRRPDPDRGREHVARARRARLPGRRQRLGQDDPGRGAGGQPRARHGQAAPWPQRQPRLPLPAHRGRRRPRLDPALPRAVARPGSRRRRPERCSGASCSRATTSASGSARSPAARLNGWPSRLLTHSDANVLILDEPTNHLDVESREALEDALTGFAGTVLLISHDRALLEAVGSRTLVIDGGALVSHHGGWAEYRSSLEAERAAAAPPPRPKSAPPRSAGPSKNRSGSAGGARARGRAGRGGVQAARGRARRPVALG